LNTFSPGRLRNSWDLTAQRQAAEAQAADAKLAQVRARTTAELATVVPARRKLWLGDFVVARPLELLFDLSVFNSFSCSHAILEISIPLSVIICK
jgi:hypothetical protein